MANAGGPYFFIDQDTTRPFTAPVAAGTAVVWSSRSPERDGPNEDAAVVIPVASDHGVIAVADGFGGHPAGDDASRLALEAIETSVRNRDGAEYELRTVILDGFEMANETVRALGVGAATTLAVVEIQQNFVRTYHCGDTGIVIVGQRGRVKTRTVDHSPTGYAMEAGVMNEREALRHEERHIVFNMVGSSEMRIDIGPSIQLAARDTIVIATDGLFDNLTFDGIVEHVRRGRIERGVARMATAARSRMTAGATPSKPDDLTIVAYRRRPAPPALPSSVSTNGADA
jgi:serine/threonine protein phosphatase PrpC